MVAGSITAAALSIGVIFGILVLLTGSIPLAIGVTLSVICITVCMCGTMLYVFGWTVGALEALMILLLVGLSVNYSLRIGEAYRYAPEPKLPHAMHRAGAAVLPTPATHASLKAGETVCRQSRDRNKR